MLSFKLFRGISRAVVSSATFSKGNVVSIKRSFTYLKGFQSAKQLIFYRQNYLNSELGGLKNNNQFFLIIFA